MVAFTTAFSSSTAVMAVTEKYLAILAPIQISPLQ
jgi:hypothetical protein